MPPEKEDLKAKLLAQAEIAIEAMLKDPKVNPQMSLSEMEQAVGVVSANLERQMMQELVARSQAESVKVCARCGGKLRNKGKRRKIVESVRGEIEVERSYYTCVECGTSSFPPRSATWLKRDGL